MIGTSLQRALVFAIPIFLPVSGRQEQIDGIARMGGKDTAALAHPKAKPNKKGKAKTEANASPATPAATKQTGSDSGIVSLLRRIAGHAATASRLTVVFALRASTVSMSTRRARSGNKAPVLTHLPVPLMNPRAVARVERNGSAEGRVKAEVVQLQLPILRATLRPPPPNPYD